MAAALLLLGGAAMVACYFTAEAFMPNIGLQGAVSEIIPNLIQAGGGIIGGLLAFTAYRKIVGTEN